MSPRQFRSTLLSCFLPVLSTAATAREVVPMASGGDGIEKVGATISGHTGTFLFDSGIGTSAITPAMAAMIGCRPWGKVTGFRATGERVDLPRCNEARVTVGTITTALSQIAVIDLARFMGPHAVGLSGVVGLDALTGRVVTLDVAHHQLIIEDMASLARVRRHATQVPVRLVRDAEGAALTVDLGVPTPSGTAWMEIDTGNYGPSLVDKTIAGLFSLDPSSAKAQTWRVPLPGSLAVSGPVIVKDLVLDGNLGRDVLRHLLVTLDLANGRGWITRTERDASLDPAY